MRPKPVPTTSASGYDLRPLSAAQRNQLAEQLSPEERRVLLNQGTERAVLRHAAQQQAGRHLRVPPVRAAAVQGRCEVRVGHRLAELLPAVRSGPRRGARRRQPRHDPHRDPLPALRRPSRPRVRRRPAADAQALLPELGVDGVLRRTGEEPEQQSVRLKPDPDARMREPGPDGDSRLRLCGRGAGTR